MSSLFKLNLPIRSAGWRWVPSLYVFQGLPSCMVMTTSAIFYKDMGISIESFAFWTSLVSLPWSLKPLWAPVVERFGTKRGWTLVMQLLLTILCGALALSLFTGGVFYALSLCIMLLIAFASASHDIACDGYYMLALDQKEQSFFVGIRSTFYRIAMVVATGLIPFVAGRVGAQVSATVGWASAIGGVAVAMLLLLLLCRWGMPAVAENTGRQDNGLQILWRALRSFFTHADAWRFVLFFLLYRLGEALLCKVVTPFLIEDRGAGGIGMTVDQCGMAYGTVGVIGLVVGGIAGGVLASRYGLRRLLWPMILMMNLPNLLYVVMAHFQPDALCPWVTCGILTEQLGYGFGYYGTKLMLEAQMLGLNSCWVAMSFNKGAVTKLMALQEGEKVVNALALGYGETQGIPHRTKPMKKLCRCDGPMPDWFRKGMETVMLAPTAINQQQFLFTLADGTVSARAKLGPCSQIDLGIVKYYFEIGSGKKVFSQDKK